MKEQQRFCPAHYCHSVCVCPVHRNGQTVVSPSSLSLDTVTVQMYNKHDSTTQPLNTLIVLLLFDGTHHHANLSQQKIISQHLNVFLQHVRSELNATPSEHHEGTSGQQAVCIQNTGVDEQDGLSASQQWCHSLRFIRFGLLLLWDEAASLPVVIWVCSCGLLLCSPGLAAAPLAPFWELEPFGLGILVGPGRRNASRGICRRDSLIKINKKQLIYLYI